MKKISKILLAILSFQISSSLFAQNNLKEILPSNIYDQAVSEGTYKQFNQDGDYEYHVLPACEYSDLIRSIRVPVGGMNMVAEQVYVVKKDDLKKTRSYENGQPDIKDAAEIFTCLTKMKDVVYYSNTRHKDMLLYKVVAYIESLENPVEKEDLKLRDTNGVESYFKMHDASFGLNHFIVKYRQNENTLFVNVVNMDDMGFAGVKGVRAKDLIINYLVIDCGDCYVLYLGADIKMVKVPGMRTKIIKSYNSRLSAIYNWFKLQF